MGLFSSKSVIFDGVNEYVTMGDVLGFEYNEPFSFSAWVKTTGTIGYVLSKRESGPEYRGWGAYIHASGVLGVDLCSAYTTLTQITIHASTTINDGNWHHVVVTWDGNASPGAPGLLVYIDGSLETPTVIYNALGTNTLVNSASLNVGARTDSEVLLAGSVDEVAVYDKELSSLEVREIYGGKEPNDLSVLGSYSNCVAWWRMGDGDTFPTLTDNAGSYNGTMTNMESGDIVEDTPEGDYTDAVGGGEELITYYRMRARDSGVAPPGYVSWTATEPDFIGNGYSGGTPTPVGPMIAGSVVKLAEWSS
jgi:hypothetical protein